MSALNPIPAEQEYEVRARLTATYGAVIGRELWQAALGLYLSSKFPLSECIGRVERLQQEWRAY